MFSFLILTYEAVKQNISVSVEDSVCMCVKEALRRIVCD